MRCVSAKTALSDHPSKIIVFEQAIRFLTDYLAGDVYYKVEYELHNLNRAKNQFTLLASIEEQTDEMEKVIDKYSLKKEI